MVNNNRNTYILPLSIRNFRRVIIFMPLLSLQMSTQLVLTITGFVLKVCRKISNHHLKGVALLTNQKPRFKVNMFNLRVQTRLFLYFTE